MAARGRAQRATGEKGPDGMLRRHPRAGWVDPQTGRLIEFWVEGVLPSDNPLEGLRQWNTYYKVDGGPVQQVIHRGVEFGPRHPLPGVWTGKNSVMMGDMAGRPLGLRLGTVPLPVSIGSGFHRARRNRGGDGAFRVRVVLNDDAPSPA